MALALAAALLLALHGGVLGWPFLSDDFIFLSASRSLGQLFSAFDQFPNYFRPIGRELYFFLGHLVAGNRPLAFHVANLLLLLGIVALVARLGARLAGPRAGVLAGAVYALLYPHRTLLAWVSCSQDLLATLFVLLAAHALLSGRRLRAACWHLAALLSKESVAAFPLVHLLWRALEAPPGTSWPARARRAARESLPLWIATAGWAVLVLGVRTLRNAWAVSETTPVADVSLSPGALWEGMRSALLSYMALEQPWSLVIGALVDPRQPWWPLAAGAACVVLAVILASRLGPRAPLRWRRPESVVVLGAVWAVVGAIPVALAGHHFSAYYVCFAGAGFALLAGRALAAASPAVAGAFLVATTALNLAANRVDVFNLTRHDPIGGVSYITISRLNHERVFLDSLRVALMRMDPERGAVVYLSHGPRYMTFATSDHRAPRIWLGDPTFDLDFIGRYRPGEETRPHGFLRFDTLTRGFLRVANDVMDADVAADLAMRAGRPREARAHLERALALLPEGSLPGVRLDLLNNRGYASYMLGDTAEARRSWLAALAIEPTFRAAALNLARTDAESGRLQAARERIERLLGDSPGVTDAWSLLVRIQWAQGDLSGANASLARLATLDPQLAATLRGRPPDGSAAP